jgi:cell wall-associated NlpC family hydrolase
MKESSKGGAKRRRRTGGTGSTLLVVALVAALPDAAGAAPAALARAVPDTLPGLGDTAGFDLPGGDTFVDVPPPVLGAGLATPTWRPESRQEQDTELAALAHTRPATTTHQPFAVAAAVILDARQDRLATRLLHAAPTTVRGLAPAPAAIRALAFAMAQIGKPYLWGGTGPAAFDCSGLTQQSYLHAGIRIPRTSTQQATVGVPVRLADLLPGDLLFYASDVRRASTIHHVAMYAGDGLVVHAPQTGELVHLSPVWLTEYIGAVRLVPAVGRPAGPATGPAMLPGPTTPVPVPPTKKPPKPPGSSVPPAATPTDPPTSTEPPTSTPPTSEPPTSEPPTSEPPTSEPPTSPSDPPTSPSDPPTTSSEPPGSGPAPSDSAAPSQPVPSDSAAPTQSAPTDAVPTDSAPADSAAPTTTP